ncbi:MAG: NAD-dependent protein deacylase, partial [Chloroflexi bacterium]
CLECEARLPRDQADRMNREHCPPSCPACGGRFLKPTVVLFGEALPMPALRDAQAMAMAADVVLIVGSSLLVYPAAGIPRMALEHGADLCIVNAEPTPLDDLAAVVLHGKAGEILPEVVRQVAAS